MKKPIIGITCGWDMGPIPKSKGYPEAKHVLGDYYIKAVENAGGVPVVLPLCTDYTLARNIVDALDGVILSGGPDVDVRRFGARAMAKVSATQPRRDAFDMEVATYALNETEIPVLGICRGCQVINVAKHGTLVVDLPSEGKLEHRLDMYPRDILSHDITVKEGSRLHKLLGATEAASNSYHHQAVEEPGEGLEIVAYSSPDNVVEAIEMPGERFVMGIQWHPEGLVNCPEHQNIFKELIAHAIAYSEKKSK